MTVTSRLLTRNDCYREGKPLTPQGILLHSTAAPGVMAEAFAARWDKSFAAGETSRQACVHAFVDPDGAVQCLPWNMRGWHAGSGSKGTVNDTHIGIELCEPAGAVYNRNGTAFSLYDAAAQAPYFEAVWDNAVQLCADLCRQYHLDPLADGVLLCHREAHDRGLASNHADVLHWFPKHGKTMDDFRAAVAARVQQAADAPARVRYRVQVGAFTNRAYAEALLARLRSAGFDGFIAAQ